ncbi:class I SAM-dependent methyltransferase [Prosthecobacter sp.]|uniref:class I SAM-dependent methyltransferase n=1 Tax=Prosthecobacter sp. TaxID=1965333 RepID=UPI0037834877
MSFDLLAPHYRWMEALCAGGQLQRCRTALLGAIPAPRMVLIYGEGNGRFLVELCRRFPQAQVTVVEGSAVMIELAHARLKREGLAGARVEFIHADALKWQPPVAAFDLLVTCFFLDCFRADQLQQLVPAIASAAAAGAHWLHADFQIAPTGLMRMCSRVIVKFLYVFFRCVTRLPAHELVDVAPCLSAAGFTRRQRREFILGLLFCDLWRL